MGRDGTRFSARWQGKADSYGGSNASWLPSALWLIDPQQLPPERPHKHQRCIMCFCFSKTYTIAFAGTKKGQFSVQMKPLRESVYTHTSEGKSRSDWLLNKANRHDRKAFKSALDKQSPSKIAFDRREGFSPRCSSPPCRRWPTAGAELGAKWDFGLERDLRSELSFCRNKQISGIKVAAEHRESFLKPFRLIYQPWGWCFKGIRIVLWEHFRSALLFLFFFFLPIFGTLEILSASRFLWCSWRDRHLRDIHCEQRAIS